MPGVKKEVVYFLTRTEQKQIRPREGEIAEVEWVPLAAAESSLTHENDKTVLRAARRKIAAEKRAKERAAAQASREREKADRNGEKKT